MTHDQDTFNRRILIVDDNRALHDHYRKVLHWGHASPELAELEAAVLGRPSGSERPIRYEVDSAFQGEGGLAMVSEAVDQNHPYAVAFVDMRMPPGWGGVETIERMWQQDPNLQIVLCTTFSDFCWSDIASRLGHTDQWFLLKKSFDMAEVCQLASALTTKWNLALESQKRHDEMQLLVSERTHRLRDSLLETERLLGAISSIAISVDVNGIVDRWNCTAESVFNIASSDAVGRRLVDLPIDWADRSQVESLIRDCGENSPTGIEIEYSMDDQRRVLGVSVYPVRNDAVTDGCLILAADLTDKMQLQRQLHQAQRLESVGQLAAGVAHEINTPMQYVGDNADYLQKAFHRLVELIGRYGELVDSARDGQVPPEMLQRIRESEETLRLDSLLKQIPDAINDTRHGIQTVARIVRAMKEFAHPGTGGLTMTDVNSALDTTVTVARGEWKYVAEVQTDLDPDIPRISAFADELNQVFLNLLVNAAHAIEDVVGDGRDGKGTIRISTRRLDDAVEIRIEDSGSGIPHELQHKVFDPFFTTKEVGKGTGQGLAIAHSVIVQRHAGQIWLESERGKGTTFFVHLPYCNAGRAEPLTEIAG